MGQKKILEPYQLMASTAVSGTTTFTSSPVNVRNTDNVGIQLKWTGTPTGTWTILHSPDNVDYDSITLSPVITQPAGTAGTWSVILQLEAYSWVKVQYVNASSTGHISIKVTAKDLN